MKTKVKRIAFIPARGGSTGVPGKNIRILNGKALIRHTVDFALSQNFFESVLISTDNAEIAQIACNFQLSANEFHDLEQNQVVAISDRTYLHRRLDSQAETLSPIREVLFDFAKRNDEFSSFDYLIMLQPTSPYRNPRDLEEISKLIKNRPEWTSIASFTSVGGLHPDRMYRKRINGLFEPFIGQNNADNKPRQLLEELFIKDGAYYVFKRELLQNRVLMGDLVKPLYRQGLGTINIDTEQDFLIASLVGDLFIQQS